MRSRSGMAVYRLNTGTLHFRQLTEAKEAFMKVISIDPRSAQGFACLGMIHHSLNELDDAITRYHEALSILPLDANVIELLNIALANNATLDPLTSPSFTAFTASVKNSQTTNAQAFIDAGSGSGAPRRIPGGLSLPPNAGRARIDPGRVGTNPSWNEKMAAKQEKFEGRAELPPNLMDGQGPAYRHMQLVANAGALPAAAAAMPSAGLNMPHDSVDTMGTDEADSQRVVDEISMHVGDDDASMDVED